MKIDVLGCGSAFSCTQNTSALRVIDADNKQWLIDCGPTVPRALWQRGGGVNAIDAIYFTHVHPDHCTGLTALLNYWKSGSRQKPLIIYCQPAQQPVLMQLTALANSFVGNFSSGSYSKAVQNLATNNGCTSCN